MLVYIIATILTGLIMLPAQHYYKKHKEVISSNNGLLSNKVSNYGIICFLLFVLAAMPYFFVSAFRSVVGTDFYSYYRLEYYYMYYNSDPEAEFGYNFLVKFLANFTYNPQWFFIITSFLFCLFIFISIKRYTNHWALAGVLVMVSCTLFDSFNNVRQSLALAFGICGLSYACDKKYIRSVVLLFFAYSFHRTVLFIAPLYLIGGIKSLRKTYYFLAVIIMLGTPFYIDFLKLILSGTKYANYFDWPLRDDNYFWFLIIQQAPILLFVLRYYNELSKKNNKMFILAIANVIATVSSIIAIRSPAVEPMFRVYRWFNWPLIFIIPMMLDIDEPIYSRVAYIVLSMIFLIVPLYFMIVVNFFHEVYPYNSYFEELVYAVKTSVCNLAIIT